MTALTQTITLTNDLAEIPRLADFVDAVCAPLEPTPKDTLALQLTLEEAVTNIINHGYRDGRLHSFTVALTVDGRAVTAVVTDDAPAFDPLARPEVDTSLPIDQRPIGGLGVHLIKKLMHRASYERRNDRNILTLEQQLRPSAPT
jgi:anti-sigma regulatory factor (Ser/Thr protein kinase)